MKGPFCILNDGYDREVFAQALSHEPSLKKALEKTGRILPHAEPLLTDLFSALFKLNIVLAPQSDVITSALINRRLLSAITTSDTLRELRVQTQLDESRSVAAVVVLVDGLLSTLLKDHRVLADELMEIASIAHDEDLLEELTVERDHLDELDEHELDQKQRENLEQTLEQEMDSLKKRLGRARDQQQKLSEELSREIENEMSWKISSIAQQMDQLDQSIEEMGLGKGSSGKVSAHDRLELGQRLLKSKKLRMLAKLVGAFREVAFEARRKKIARSPQELHQISMGSELDRLLPSELLALSPSRGQYHLDFVRRFLESQLLQYQLEGAAERGPIVVCVDGSGSMRGSKELWAKAVALTLMEIARRERRRCLAIVFSDSREIFEVELLAPKTQHNVRSAIHNKELLKFAEFFPGGGTNFEQPLKRAVGAVSTGNYRRGDIVFITDGQASVAEDLIEEINEKRKKHHFKIRGIEVDIEQSQTQSLERFCDDIRRVSDLTTDSLSDVFASI